MERKTARYLIRDEVPTKSLSMGGLGCDACGFPIEGPHYSTGPAPEGTNHCSLCHRIGADWASDGDSERVDGHLPPSLLAKIRNMAPDLAAAAARRVNPHVMAPVCRLHV